MLRMETQYFFEALPPLVEALMRNSAHQIDVDVVKARSPCEFIAVEKVIVAVNPAEQL